MPEGRFPHESGESSFSSGTMSFFGKLKNLGPPAPPKRTENTVRYGWPEGEFDEEDGDTYEAPPCERPAVSVEHRTMEENVYIERSPASHVPNRQAPPSLSSKTAPIAKAMKPEPNRDLKETYFDPSIKKPPQVNRKKKPVLNNDPPPRPAPVPVPVNIPAPQCEEDVYLDPNEGQDSDDLYLEPKEAACSPSPRPAAWMHPPVKSLPREPPPPIMKPPIPRAMANCPTASNAARHKSVPVEPLRHYELNPRIPPAPEVRRPPFPVKRPSPTPVIKPLLPVSLKETKPSPPAPPGVESHTAVKVSPVGPKSPSLSGTKVSRLQDMEWFAGSCDRKEAESVLLGVKKDGAFLVRHSSAQSVRQPYTLVVLYQEKVYNIPVRFLEETQSYALGKEGKKTEEIFGSLQEIVSHHTKNPILLIDSKSQAKQTTYLTHPARP